MALNPATESAEAASPFPISLFERFRAGDEEALCQVAEAIHPRLVGYLRVLGRGIELAEDAAQEALLEAYRQRARIVGPHQLRSWIYTVARRVVFRELSRARNRAEVALDPEDLENLAPAEPGTQGLGLVQAQSRRALKLAMAGLNPTERDLLLLRYFGDLSHKEIADALEMPLGSVGVKLGRALAKARQALERNGLGPEDLL